MARRRAGRAARRGRRGKERGAGEEADEEVRRSTSEAPAARSARRRRSSVRQSRSSGAQEAVDDNTRESGRRRRRSSVRRRRSSGAQEGVDDDGRESGRRGRREPVERPRDLMPFVLVGLGVLFIVGLVVWAPVERMIYLYRIQTVGDDEIAENTRDLAAQALAEHKGAAIEKLLEIIVTHEDPAVKDVAARAVGLVGHRWKSATVPDEICIAPLLELATGSDMGPGIRRAATYGLGESRRASAGEALEKVLDDSDPGVRKVAARTFGRIKAPSAVRGCLKALADMDAEVRAQARESIQRSITADRASFELILGALGDSNDAVAGGALAALQKVAGRAQSKDVLPLLEDLIDEKGKRTPRSPETKVNVIRILQEIADEPAKIALHENVEDPSPLVRKACIEAIAAAAVLEYINDVTKRLITDTEPSVRAAAAIAIGQMKQPSTVPFLVEVIAKRQEQPQPPRVLVEVVKALRRFDELPSAFRWKAVRQLINLLDHPAPEVRTQVPESLKAASGRNYSYTKSQWETWWKNKEWEIKAYEQVREMLGAADRIMSPDGTRDSQQAVQMLEKADALLAQILQRADAEDKGLYLRTQEQLNQKRYGVMKHAPIDVHR